MRPLGEPRSNSSTVFAGKREATPVSGPSVGGLADLQVPDDPDNSSDK